MSTAEAPVGRPPPPGTPPERVRELITPEGIDLKLRLADMSERATAFFIDIAIMVGILVGGTLIVFLFALGLGRRSVEVIAIIWLLGSFFLRNFYFMAFELTPRAATPGKRALGLRVTTRNGGPLGFDAIFARNAMRELELFLPLSFLSVYGREAGGWGWFAGLIWCAVFVFFPLFNRDRLRVGDFIAGTWVIRAPKRSLELDLASPEQKDNFLFTRDEVDAYGIKELSVLEEVLRRKDPPTMEAVASRIRNKLKRGRAFGESDQQFLEAYYRALRARLETRMLFGHRRRDKFDKT
ncbi:MAG TPA: RDD family protein [Micropepsaceae bacterium]|nr:RDD family protein [Micropepsaceae bacterium]